MRQITAYQCAMCGKVYVTKPAANKHEGRCIKDPEHKTCATCIHNPSFGKAHRCEHWPEKKTFRQNCPGYEYRDA
jgi:hypothetical protein